MAVSRLPVVRNLEQPALSRAQDNINSYIAPVVQSVNARPIMGAPPPPWIVPDLLNGWTWYLTDGGKGYHKNALGYVYLNIQVTNSSGGAIVGGTLICVLPVGYRPRTDMEFACSAHSGVDPITLTKDGALYDNSNVGAGAHVHICVTYLASY